MDPLEEKLFERLEKDVLSFVKEIEQRIFYSKNKDNITYLESFRDKIKEVIACTKETALIFDRYHPEVEKLDYGYPALYENDCLPGYASPFTIIITLWVPHEAAVEISVEYLDEGPLPHELKFSCYETSSPIVEKDFSIFIEKLRIDFEKSYDE
jgi:hypothetical protein